MLVVGDVHFDAPVRYQAGSYNLYLEDVKKTVEWVLREVAREKESVVFLGDYFERKDKILNKVKNGFLKILRKYIREKDLRYWFVVGNHDRGQDGELSIDLLRGYGRVISKSKMYEVEGMAVFFIPYREMKVEVNCKANVVVGHFRVDGAEMGMVRDGGENCYAVAEFGDCFVCNGHYHRFQRMGKAFYCLGSVVQVDWGDRAQKYVCRLDGENWEFIEVPRWIDRVVLTIGRIEELAEANLLDKYVKIVIDIDKLDVKEVMNMVQSKGAKWYELNLTRTIDRNLDAMMVGGGAGIREDINALIRNKLEEVNEEFRQAYARVIQGIVRG